MYGILRTDPESYSSQAAVVTNDILLYGIAVYVVLSSIAATSFSTQSCEIKLNRDNAGKLKKVNNTIISTVLIFIL